MASCLHQAQNIFLIELCSQAVWSEATIIDLKPAASPACAASCLQQAQKWLWSIIVPKRFGAKRHN